MIQTYIEYLYAGIIVSETSTKKVSNRNLPKKIPNGCFGFRFLDRTEEIKHGENLVGEPKNYSHWYYTKGEVLNKEQVKIKYPSKEILIKNMEYNNISKVIITKYGQAIPLGENDVVVDIK